MSTPPDPPIDDDVTALLNEAGWVRGLARRLAARESDADDVAQGTMALALEKRPPVGRGLRPWLTRVAHRVARHGVRSDARRRDRERDRARARAEHSPGAQELFERLEAQEELAAHVRALPAPYAEVLLRRYYEGQTPEAIAGSMNTTSATVRSQIARGLARLRRSIAADHSMHSGGILTFLAMAAGSEVAFVSPAAAEVLTMKISSKTVALCAAALLGASALTLVAVNDGRDGERTPDVTHADEDELARVSDPTGTQEDLEATEADAGRAVAKNALDPAQPLGVPESQRAADITTIRARIVDQDGAPLAGAVLRSIYKDGKPRGEGNEAIAGSDGMVDLELEDRALRAWRTEVYSMVFAASHDARATSFTSATPKRHQVNDLGDIELAPGGSITGFAVDDVGTAVPGVVAYASEPVLTGELETLRRRGPDANFSRPRGNGNPRGSFVVSGVAVGGARLWVQAEGKLWTISDPLEVTAGRTTDVGRVELEPVPREWTICGIVRDPGGALYAGATVAYTNGYDDGETTSGRDGSFTIFPTTESAFRVVAKTPDGPHGTSEVVHTKLGDEVVLDLALRREILVTVVDSDGRPLESASMGAFLTSDSAQGRGAYIDFREVPGWNWIETNSMGQATIIAPADRFYVSANKPGFEVGRSQPIEPQGAPEELELVLEPEPVIAGRVTHNGKPVADARIEVLERIDGFFPRQFGFTQRLFPNAGTDNRTDANGLFEVPVDEEHTSVSLLVTAEGFATSELQLELVAGEGLEGVEVEMLVGGIVTGRLIPPAGEDPSKLFVAASRGDNKPVWVRPDADGSYEICLMTPGPWRVEGRDEEPSGEILSVANRPEDKEFNWNVDVVDGESVVFDVDMRQLGDVAIHGRLTIDGEPAKGWIVTTSQPRGTSERRRPHSVETGDDGRFVLQVRSGSYDLELKGTLDGGARVVMTRPLKLAGTRFDWEEDLRTGEIDKKLESAPARVRLVRGRYYDGEREVTTLDVQEENRVLGRVPVGSSHLQIPTTNASFPHAWSSVGTVDVDGDR